MVGASFDTIEEQKTFATEQEFPYKLISDSDKSIGKSYQAERTPDMPMHEYGIPRRITYLINPEGIIIKTYNLDVGEPDLASHAADVLADIKSMS